ncbi:MAG: MgtC/SapB family protein [Desulfobacteraceae bacterium]|nr:MgtC/SapB family protein [Desulfobacteraceae bacterium]
MDNVTFLTPGLWLRIIVSVLCGAMIGLDRQLRGKPAGIRTSSLITLGTTIFVTLSAICAPGQADQLRVLSQVVTGIGFLGAGVIMSKERSVTGVTSAAVIWVLATIGAAAGMGHFGMAFAVTLATLAVLLGVEWLEESFQKLRSGPHRRDSSSYEQTEE